MSIALVASGNRDTPRQLLQGNQDLFSRVCVPLLSGTCWFENLEGTHKGIIYCHHCSSIVKFTAIVWCGENSDEFSSSKEFVPVLNDLMSSHNKIQIVSTKELTHNIATKCKGNTTIILTPSLLATECGSELLTIILTVMLGAGSDH